MFWNTRFIVFGTRWVWSSSLRGSLSTRSTWWWTFSEASWRQSPRRWPSDDDYDDNDDGGIEQLILATSKERRMPKIGIFCQPRIWVGRNFNQTLCKAIDDKVLNYFASSLVLILPMLAIELYVYQNLGQKKMSKIVLVLR